MSCSYASRAAALALCILLAGCRTPASPPPADAPPVAILGASVNIDFVGADFPPDATAPLPPRLTIQDAIVRALAASPEVQAALARARVAEADARQERLLPNPLLSVSFRLAEAGASPGLDLGIAQDVFALLTRPDRSGAADARLRAAVEEAIIAALDVAAEAASLAAAVRAAEDRLPLLEQHVRILERVRDAARARFDSGEGKPLDVSAAEGELAAAELDVAEARGEARAARLALARRLGRPGDDATWSIEPLGQTAGPSSEAAWIDAALERRPEIRAVGWEIAALESEAQLAGLAPRDGTTAGFDAEGTKDWEFGPSVTLPLPVFDDGSVRRDGALARIAEAHHRRTEASRRAVEEVRTAWSAREVAAAARRVAEERLLPLAERRRSQADAVYAAGEADLADVLLAEAALQEARLRIAGLRARESQAQIRLHRAAGGAAPDSPSPAGSQTEEGSPHEAR
ncbi:MAG: hypothetical protein HMLKMBBP_01125 [Planctomycetes bacterium]|nr:hypothetical protein [Planctomycetota bacterium]